jgi:FKBP-type peptidyl-prolyl cis-trans isomerase
LRHLSLVLLAGVLFADETKTVTTESGLIVETLAEGKAGTTPATGDRVKVHYTGRLTDGTKFDSSHDRGQPIEFTLGFGFVIAGWEEGVALMNVGQKCKLTIPWQLAYGEEGRGTIPPKADLVFEVELVAVEKGDPLPAFRPADAERQQTTESGLKWEAIEEGSGDPPGADDLVKLRCTVWTADGTIAFTSAAIGQPVVGPAAKVRLTRFAEKFLPEAAQLMKPGGSYRFEVPPALCWGEEKVLPKVAQNQTSVWQIDFEGLIRFAPWDSAKATKTATGLEYVVLEEGAGDAPGATDQVAVLYTGWLEDGKEFDSAHRRGQPAMFQVNGVIPGWQEGLKLMREGAIYRFRIPAALAYGEKGTGGIPPNATLLFEVELLRVRKP